MESLFNTNINTNTETDNILYNIINTGDPKYIFMYGIIIIIFIFISTKISYNYNILIGLIFCSLIIYYLYTFRKYNILTQTQINNEKFNLLYSKNQILSKYPKIVDFLFYMEGLKSNNIQEFENLILAFEKYCKLYEYCLIDYNLIFTSYNNLIDQKIKILNIINSFIFTTPQIEYEKILIKQKISAENLLDELLNNLFLLYKKKIYYDGYNRNSNIISKSNVLPYNILYESNYREHYDKYNISNLIFF